MNLTVFGDSGGAGDNTIALATQRDHHGRAGHWATPGIPPQPVHGPHDPGHLRPRIRRPARSRAMWRPPRWAHVPHGSRGRESSTWRAPAAG
jgi:hypothetical protein